MGKVVVTLDYEVGYVTMYNLPNNFNTDGENIEDFLIAQHGWHPNTGYWMLCDHNKFNIVNLKDSECIYYLNKTNGNT